MSETPDALDLLAGEYVLGTLAGEERDAFARRLAADADARRMVAAWRSRLAPLAESVAEEPPPPRLWTAIKDRIAKPGPNLTIRAAAGDWQEIHAGVTMKELSVDPVDGRRSFLLRLAPGASLPAHDHPSDEECLVMEGAIAIGDLALHAGDYHRAARDLPHPPIASSAGALLFVRGYYAA